MSTDILTSVKIRKLPNGNLWMTEYVWTSNVIPHNSKYEREYTKHEAIERLGIVLKGAKRDDNRGCTQIKNGIEYLEKIIAKLGGNTRLSGQRTLFSYLG